MRVPSPCRVSRQGNSIYPRSNTNLSGSFHVCGAGEVQNSRLMMMSIQQASGQLSYNPIIMQMAQQRWRPGISSSQLEQIHAIHSKSSGFRRCHLTPSNDWVPTAVPCTSSLLGFICIACSCVKRQDAKSQLVQGLRSGNLAPSPDLPCKD